MITGIDHIIILVDDLSTAMRQYESVGFVVTRGGVHPGAGTENALIPLADGSYLELLAVADPVLAIHHPKWSHPDGTRRKGGEYGGFALSTDDIDADVQRIAGGGLTMTPPADGSRERPDGTMVRWRVSSPPQRELPFLIQDVTPRDVRIAAPPRGLGLHAAISEVRIAAADLPVAVRAYSQLLDTPALGAAPAAGEVHFLTPRGEITVLEHAAGNRIAGILEITLGVADWRSATRELLPVLEHRPGGWQVPHHVLGGTRILLRPKVGP
ncbi:MAG TPA: VOC family protein [bacterium]|jgi:hypothetical protein